MKTSIVKRIVKWTAITMFFLIAVLAVHIYMVTKPRVDAHTRIMARIDIHQPVSQQQADELTGWLYRQQGVDHVLCNPANGIVVFTYSPLKANADDIASRFRSSLDYPNAVRFVPTKKELMSSCPVASTSFLYKTYSFIKSAF